MRTPTRPTSTLLFLGFAMLLGPLACDSAGSDSTTPADDVTTPETDAPAGADGWIWDDVDDANKCTGVFRIEHLDGTPADAPAEGLDFLFDQTALRKFHLELKPQDWEWLQENALAEEYVPANLVYEDLRYTGIGVRFKGAWSTLLGCFDEQGNQVCDKLSLKLRFNKYDPCGRFYGLRRLIFNSSIHDDSMMRERLMYNVYAHLGVKASRASHALLSVNDQKQSVYVLVEPVDKEWVQRRFDDDNGNLYKEAWPTWNDEWQFIDSLRTNEDEADVSFLLEFAQVILDHDEDDMPEAISPYVDLEQIATVLATGRAILDRDGLTRFWCEGMFGDCYNHNFYWYHQPGSQLYLVPWDLDITFFGYHEANEVLPSWWEKPSDCKPVPLYVLEGEEPDADNDDLVKAAQCDPIMHAALDAHADTYMATLKNIIPALYQAVEDLESYRVQLSAPLAADPRFDPTMEEWKSEVDWFKKKMGQQIQVLEEIAEQN